MTVRDRSDVRTLDSPAGVAEAVADFFVGAAQRALERRGRFDVALAGGSTPRAVHALLAAEPHRSRVAWESVRFFFGDERCVPPDDPDSNYGMARDTLLRPLGINEEHVFRMRGEDEPARGAEEYVAVLERELGAPFRLDFIMLGMGPDGHTASLFPGTSPLVDNELLVRAPFVAQFDMYRITLTPRVINAASDVLVATEGTAKAAALAHVLDGPFEPVTYPAQILQPSSGCLTWVVDKAALGGS